MVERDNNGNKSVSENEVAPASDCMTYEAWWDPFPDNREPYYGGYNNKFDHAAACWLLFADRVFFNDGDITWDGKHHTTTGIQINATHINKIPVLMKLRNNYMPAFLELMDEIEKDEGLIIPRNFIHPVVQKALPKGNLTGITLMNLQACSDAVMITQQAANEYFVIVDARVRSGIPDFTNLIGRLIWDLRAYNEVDAPFGVRVAGSRNTHANVFFGNNLSLDKPVAGASGECTAVFTRKPKVHLPSKEEVERASRTFVSGMDREQETYSLMPGIDVFTSSDIKTEHDEELFELELYKLAESFPLTIPIEGTGYLGRVERIEDVKVGDSLVLASDWRSEYFSPCCIEVFNDKGETLGNLQKWRGSITNCGNRELALLLPYVTATVESVTPKSQRRKNAKYALMDVRLVLDKSILSKSGRACKPEVLEGAKDTLRLPAAKRITMSKSPLTCFDLKGNIDPSQMPKTKKRTATSKNGIESSTATSREENKKSGKVSKTANGTPKTKTPKAKQAQKAFSAKGSDEKTKERPSDKKLTPLQRAEQAHKIIVKECEKLIGHNHSLSDDETKLLVCSKLLECGGGLTKDELITALWDELKKVLKKRTSSESMDYETGDIMIGSFLEAYSKPFLEVYSSVSPCGRSYSVLTREIVNWTAHPDRYYLTPQTDSDDKPMPDYYALYLMYKKKLNDLNDMSAEARKRRASITLLEKKFPNIKRN